MSDFITEETGRLVQLDQDRSIINDARKIIYPGADGDAWWDMAQLFHQMENAIQIFNNTHSGCQAPFLFDLESSAHASLAPDALRAFDIKG